MENKIKIGRLKYDATIVRFVEKDTNDVYSVCMRGKQGDVQCTVFKNGEKLPGVYVSLGGHANQSKAKNAINYIVNTLNQKP